MKIVLLTSVIVGVGVVVIGEHPFLRKTVIAFNSKIYDFFDRNKYSKAARKAAKESKSKLEKWIAVGITVMILVTGTLLSSHKKPQVDIV